MANQTDTLGGMVRELRKLKDKKEKVDAQLKELNGQIRTLAEQKIPDYMEEHDIEKHSVKGIGTVYLTTKVYANVKAEDRETFFSWLREHGNGDLIKETVHAQTLNAFAKEQLSEGNALPDVLTARLYPTANLRRT